MIISVIAVLHAITSRYHERTNADTYLVLFIVEHCLCALHNADSYSRCATSNLDLSVLLFCPLYLTDSFQLQLETIGTFLEGCKKYGMSEKDLFVSLDLHEQQNKNMVWSKSPYVAMYSNT